MAAAARRSATATRCAPPSSGKRRSCHPMFMRRRASPGPTHDPRFDRGSWTRTLRPQEREDLRSLDLGLHGRRCSRDIEYGACSKREAIGRMSSPRWARLRRGATSTGAGWLDLRGSSCASTWTRRNDRSPSRKGGELGLHVMAPARSGTEARACLRLPFHASSRRNSGPVILDVCPRSRGGKDPAGEMS